MVSATAALDVWMLGTRVARVADNLGGGGREREAKPGRVPSPPASKPFQMQLQLCARLPHWGRAQTFFSCFANRSVTMQFGPLTLLRIRTVQPHNYLLPNSD